MSSNDPSGEAVETSVKTWLQQFVVGLNLCPFARAELDRDAVRFAVSTATSEQDLLQELGRELRYLQEHPDTQTTLLIHPRALTEFYQYNQFLDLAEELLVLQDWEGVFQIASFHPDYQFADTAPEDAENYSNRSPYPLLHLLREDSLAQAVARHPDPAGIPARNIALLDSMGAQRLAEMLSGCFGNES